MGRTVLITGTSSGLGRATANLFQLKGWNVVATMRDLERAGNLSQLERTLVTRPDVQDFASIENAIGAGLDRFGDIDVLVNNAGYGAYGPLEATSIEKIQRQLDTNVLGVFATTRALLPHFRAAKRGTIVNISSIGGKIAFPLGALYHASKFAVEGLSEALQYELKPLGVRVKVVEPGGIQTDFVSRSLDFSNSAELTEYQPLVQSLQHVFGPMMEAGSTAEQTAEVVYTAATDESDQLRFEAGADAMQILANRRASNDIDFFGGMRAQFGL